MDDSVPGFCFLAMNEELRGKKSLVGTRKPLLLLLDYSFVFVAADRLTTKKVTLQALRSIVLDTVQSLDV